MLYNPQPQKLRKSQLKLALNMCISKCKTELVPSHPVLVSYWH